MTNDELSLLVLPWAKEQEPENYAKTLAVASKPPTFRRFLLRLVERRCAVDKEFLRSVPMTLLEETAYVQRMVIRDGEDSETIEVRGSRALPRVWGFLELHNLVHLNGATKKDVIERHRFKVKLDLVKVEP